MICSLYSNFKDVIVLTSPMIFVSIVILISLRFTYLYKNKVKFVIYKELMLFFFVFYVLCLFQIVTSNDVSGSYGSNFVPFKEIFPLASVAFFGRASTTEAKNAGFRVHSQRASAHGRNQKVTMG